MAHENRRIGQPVPQEDVGKRRRAVDLSRHEVRGKIREGGPAAVRAEGRPGQHESLEGIDRAIARVEGLAGRVTDQDGGSGGMVVEEGVFLTGGIDLPGDQVLSPADEQQKAPVCTEGRRAPIAGRCRRARAAADRHRVPGKAIEPVHEGGELVRHHVAIPAQSRRGRAAGRRERRAGDVADQCGGPGEPVMEKDVPVVKGADEGVDLTFDQVSGVAHEGDPAAIRTDDRIGRGGVGRDHGRAGAAADQAPRAGAAVQQEDVLRVRPVQQAGQQIACRAREHQPTAIGALHRPAGRGNPAGTIGRIGKRGRNPSREEVHVALGARVPPGGQGQPGDGEQGGGCFQMHDSIVSRGPRLGRQGHRRNSGDPIRV